MYERRHSLEISAYGGVATPAPNLAIVFLITTLASIGLPTLNNFVGEYLVLQGTAIANFAWAVFAAVGVILSACYMLWLYQRTFYGRASESLSHHMPDLTPREWAAILPLLLLMVWMGSFTQSFLPLDQRAERAHSGTDQEAASRAGGATGPADRGGVPCPLTSCRPAPSTSAFLPEIILTLAGVLIMFLEASAARRPENASPGCSRSLALVLALPAALLAKRPGAAFSDMLIIDGFATFFRRW